jgi:hypothetical protein
MTAADVREQLCSSRWYLTGFLVPTDTPEEQKTEGAATREVDETGDAGGTERVG